MNTVIVPIGPGHEAIAERAIASVTAQTVHTALIVIRDPDRRGPGWARNQGLTRVRTPFVTFLDADDWLEPLFTERTLAVRQAGRYVYTDWYEDGKVKAAPDKPWCGGTWHVVTTLLPTSLVIRSGGFEEGLPGAEDTEFYLKLSTRRQCGQHLAEPLMHYSGEGRRGKAFVQGPDHDRVMAEISRRYKGLMGCCGGQPMDIPPAGDKQAGDVLAMAIWGGNRSVLGRTTGRMYPRTGNGKRLWVDPRDMAAMPDLFAPVILDEPAVDDPLALVGLDQVADALMGAARVRGARPNPYAAIANEEPAPPPAVKPDVSRVIRLAKRPVSMGEPTFIFPAMDYPSYSDIKRLVELSGFEMRTFTQGQNLDLDVAYGSNPLIIVSPEPIPNMNDVQARVICWQLEYAGDYTHNYDGFTGEVWASDKAWAEARGARYVLMGSHPGLGEGYIVQRDGHEYDVTMLAYMTPRRQAIKDDLASLKWPADYPGHATTERHKVLMNTRLMLHVHQHDNAPFVAPQRLALAAAYHMPVISETTPGLGDLADYVTQADYNALVTAVTKALKRKSLAASGEQLHQFLCVERTFRDSVLEALK